MMTSAVLLGEPHDGQRVTLLYAPVLIEVNRVRYRRIDDPETGEPLGAYVIEQDEEMPCTSVTDATSESRGSIDASEPDQAADVKSAPRSGSCSVRQLFCWLRARQSTWFR